MLFPGSEIGLDPKYSVSLPDKSASHVLKRPSAERLKGKEPPPPRSLYDILGVYIGGPSGRRLGTDGHSQDKYQHFADFIL